LPLSAIHQPQFIKSRSEFENLSPGAVILSPGLAQGHSVGGASMASALPFWAAFEQGTAS
jgi:hypothetical protein